MRTLGEGVADDRIADEDVPVASTTSDSPTTSSSCGSWPSDLITSALMSWLSTTPGSKRPVRPGRRAPEVPMLRTVSPEVSS